MLAPGWVAAHAVLEVADSFLLMFTLHLGRIVLVAVVAGVRLERALVMADIAGDVGAAPVVEREGVIG